MQLDWPLPWEAPTSMAEYVQMQRTIRDNLNYFRDVITEGEAMRNYLVVLVGRQTEDRAFQEIREITQGYPTTTASDVLVTRYQPIRKPGNWRFMAVARITVGESGRLPELRPEMHLIAVD